MVKTNKYKIGVLGVMMLILLNQASLVHAASYDNLAAYGVDTIAGYSTILSTSKTFPNQEVSFTVKKPDGGSVVIKSRTDVSGVAKADLYDFHTRRSGKYAVSATVSSPLMQSPVSSFTVYPDAVSADQSSIVAQSSVARAGGSDKVYITVNLKDKYGNPLQGHSVSLVSSRGSDSIENPVMNQTTDLNGSLSFIVSSSEPGLSIYSAVDSTAGVVINSKAQVAYINSSSLSGAGGSVLGIQYAAAASAGPINHFEIGDLPATINPNQNISFRVTAKDQDGLTVENYTGTIHFSSEGTNSSNVTLPEDYSFKAEDLGTHLFSLGLKFTVAGTYKIVATDISNQLLKGEKSVTVGSSGGQVPPGGQGTEQKPAINSPTSGTYGQNTVTISGSAGAGLSVKVLDNGQEIGVVQASTNGSFSYQANQLADGAHKLSVQTVDQTQTVIGTSDTIEITIDTTPPKVDEVVLEPSTGIKADAVVTVKVLSEENLSQAALIFNNDIIQLSPSLEQTGTYTGSVKAPKDEGAYGIDVLLVDQLGNEATYQAQATINISGGEGTATSNQTQQTTQEEVPQETQQIEIPPANLPPSQVFGLVAYGSDKRVTLVWEAASDDKGITNYRIYYGTDPANLVTFVDTRDANTTWYIPNLSNGNEYYFSIAALDGEGIESINRSDLVSAIPFTLETTTNVPVAPDVPLGFGNENEALMGSAVEGYVPPEMVQNGPELIWLLFGSGLAGAVSRKIVRKKR